MHATETRHATGDVEVVKPVAVPEGITCNSLDAFGDNRVAAAQKQFIGDRLDEGIAVVTRVIFAVALHHYDGTQVAAVVEGFGSNAVNAVANGQILHTCAVAESILTHRSNTAADGHVFQISAALESAFGDGSDIVANDHRLQSLVFGKSICTDGGDTFREDEVGHRLAVQFHGLGIEERAGFLRSEAHLAPCSQVGDAHLSQSGATVKVIRAKPIDGAGDVHRGHGRAVLEGIVANARHTLWNNYRSQCLALCESIIGNGGETVAEFHIGQARAVLEGIGANGSDAVGHGQ